MAIHLRQICLVAEKLAPAVEDLGRIFSIPPCYVDDSVGKWGLENTLMAVGTQFLEVVAPVAADTAAGRYLKRRGGNGGYMVICQVPGREEQAKVRVNADALGVRVAFERDRKDYSLMQLHPRDMGATFLEVDWDEGADVTGNWHPAGGTSWMEAAPSGLVSAITAAELQSEDPHALAKHWSAVLGLPVEDRGGAPCIALANAGLRFAPATDGRGAGLGAVDLAVTSRNRILEQAEAHNIPVSGDRLTICGTRFNLIDDTP